MDATLSTTSSQAPTKAHSSAIKELEIQTWHIAFESILEKMSEGIPFDMACKSYNVPATVAPLSPARIRTWIFSNPKRKNAYTVAKLIGAEAVEDELLRISDGLRPDGSASLDDVPRSALKINTRKWLLTVWNRDKYGDVKKVEQTTTTRVDHSSLSTAELRTKLLQSLGMDVDTLSDEATGSIFDMEQSDSDE